MFDVITMLNVLLMHLEALYRPIAADVTARVTVM